MRLSAAELLLRPVRAHGIELGHPVDLILAPSNGRRAVGFEVLCRDEEHRFLPLAATILDGRDIAVASTLTLLDDAELEYYRERAGTLGSLRGSEVARAGRAVGTLKDVLIGADGGIEAVVLVTDEGEVEMPYDADVELPPPSRERRKRS